jgi:hypothetical protein
MEDYDTETREKAERAALQSADGLIPVHTTKLLEEFYSLWSVSDGYESRHGLGWTDVVDAVRDIVGQVYAEIACEVINEYDYKGDE